MKTCSRCQEEKQASEFHKDRGKKDGLNYWCKPCTRERNMNWLDANRERASAKLRAWRYDNEEHCRNKRYLDTYGITLEEYNQILDEQNGCCAICKKEDNSNLSVDHDHGTGEIRGLLCRKCNSALGFFDDSLNLLQNAAEYLTRRM